MASIGSLTVDLALESANFLSGLKKSAEASEHMAHRVEAAMDLAKEATIAFVGAWSIERVAETIDQAFEYGARMVDIANKTGAGTDTIQEFVFAMRQQGASADTAEGALGKFSKALGQAENGNAKMAKTLMDLGVTSFKNLDQALKQTMEGLGKLPAQTQKNADALKLFGKSGGAAAAIANQGADGFNKLAEEAKEFGIVLDGEVLKQSKEAEDKISALKQVLAADITGAVLSNADAIGHFVDEILKLAVAIPQMLNHYDVMMKKFSLDHPFLAGRVGLFPEIGEKLGLNPGHTARVEKESGQIRDGLMGSHEGRMVLYKEAAGIYNDYVGKNGKNNDQARAYYLNAKAIKDRYVASHNLGEGHGAPLDNSAHMPAGKVKNGQKEYDGNAYEKATRQYDKEINSAKLALATTAEQKFTLEKSALDQDMADKNAIIDTDKHYTDVQKAALKGKEQEVHDLKLAAAQRAESDAFIKETYDIEIQKRGFQQDQLKSESQMAKTQSERRKLALEILDLEYKDKNAELQRTIETSHDQAEIDTAIRAQNQLGRQRANDVAQTKRDTQGPLEAWMDAIPKSAAEMNEALQKVEVDGLDKMSDSLLGVIEGTKGIGEAFSDMTKSIIEDLLKIAIQTAVVAPLAHALFGNGSSGGSSGGGLFGSLFTSILGHRANGGMTAPGTYEVGERGPELVNIDSAANVTTARNMQGSATANAGATFSFAPGSIISNDPDAIRHVVIQTMAGSMGLQAKQSTDNTLKKLRRRTI